MAAFNLIPGLYPSADNASGHGLCYSASHEVCSTVVPLWDSGDLPVLSLLLHK